jgi:hypothetical protein
MSASRLPVVAYQRDTHEPAYLLFLAKVLGERECALRRQVLAIMHEAMPGRERVPIRHVVLDGERVVGSLGHMPAEFWIQGRREPVRYTHDLLVDPEYRGPRGIGNSLVAHAYAQGDFFPGGMWMTHPSFRLHEMCGFNAVKPMSTYTLVLDTRAFLARRGMGGARGAVARGARGARRAWGRRAAPRGVSLLELARFDPSFDAAWERLAKSYGITRVRDAAYVNWKYADHPHLDYRLLIASRGDQTAGYLIWRAAPEHANERRAVVADFLVAKGDATTLRALLAQAIGQARATGTESLSILTTQAWAARVLRGLGFLPRGSRNTWVVANWRDRIPEPWLRDHDPWHVCLGDSDGDMWEAVR